MIYETSVTIADSGTVSTAAQIGDTYDLRPRSVLAVRTAANFTTADLTFQASNDGVTYNAVKKAAGASVTLTSVAASDYRALDPADLFSAKYVKVVSSVAQSGGDTVYLVVGTV